MVIMQDALPKIKRFLKGTGLSETAAQHVTGFLVAFVMHLGRMSVAQAATAVRIRPRHRAQLMRFLAENRWSRNWLLLAQLAELVLIHETRQSGRWLLLLDQTYCTQRGAKTENTFSHGKKSKSGKERRHRKKSSARRCHCFVMGLLLTPNRSSNSRHPCRACREPSGNSRLSRKRLPALPNKSLKSCRIP